MEDKRLRQRPEAEAKNIERLLARVQSGQLRIPHFQRPLRWRSHHIIELFDSIWRGFPIGELLFSKQQAPAERLKFGPLVIDAEARTDALMVVDGQQRVVSLAGVLLHPEPTPRGDIHAIWFDLEEQSFVRLTKANPPAHWIPLRAVIDSAQLLHWLNAWPLRSARPDLLNRAILLGKAIREYEVPAYIVHDAEEHALRLIFNRVNNSGVRMDETEVFDALHGTTGRKPLREACARIAEEGFGDIDSKWFLRALKAVRGIDPKKRASQIDLEGSEAAIDETERAIRLVLAFLITDAEIPHRDLLPYNLPLVILARFFQLHPNPSNRNRTLLVRWLWRGALSGVHSASSNAELRRLTSMIDDDESASVQRLLTTVPREWEMPDPRADWQTGSAKTRLLALALLSFGARDPISNQPIDISDIQGMDEPIHVFVDVTTPKRRSGTFANFVALVGDPPTQRTKLKELLSAADDVLESHALDRETAGAFANGELTTFVSSRAGLIGERAGRYFAARAGSTDSDRPEIHYILSQAVVR